MVFLILFTLLLTGCAASNQVAAPDEQPSSYTYHINPFPVTGPDGERFDFPFLGGLNIPRPQLVDIDGDGDLDLFLQEASNRVMFFENTGTAEDPVFTWRTFKYRDLDVGEWYRFNDLDFDGDLDLLTEQPFNFIRYYRNTGSPGEPNFVLAEDTLRDVEGEPIFSDRQNIPNVNDVDCDGLIDLFLGRLDGTITRYEATTSGAPPRFRLVAREFEDIQIIGRYAQPGYQPPERDIFDFGPGPSDPSLSARTPKPPYHRSEISSQAPPSYLQARNATPPGEQRRHGANTMAFADIDGDGDIDLLWGDYFEPGLLLIENIGSCRNPNFRAEPQRFPVGDPVATSGYNAPTVGDLDGDGDPDFMMGVIGGAFNPRLNAQNNLFYFEHTSNGYDRITGRFLNGIDVGSESRLAAADIDGDGDLDLLVANRVDTGAGESADVVLYENVGTAASPEFALTDTLALNPAFNYAPAVGDLDGDGAPDLVVGTWNEGVTFYFSDGAGSYEPAEHLFFELARGSHTTPTLGDFDGDGDLDLIIGETDGTLNYYRNTGAPARPAFEPVAGVVDEINVGRRSAPFAVDIDGDGDLDLVVGSEDQGLVVVRNMGTPQRPRFVREGALELPIPAPALPAPVLVDIDGDGDLDLFSGTDRGGVLFFERE